MTKAKARARAKARAAAKLAKPNAGGEKADTGKPTGPRDDKANPMRNFAGAERLNTKAAMRRGAARSR